MAIFLLNATEICWLHDNEQIKVPCFTSGCTKAQTNNQTYGTILELLELVDNVINHNNYNAARAYKAQAWMNSVACMTMNKSRFLALPLDAQKLKPTIKLTEPFWNCWNWLTMSSTIATTMLPGPTKPKLVDITRVIHQWTGGKPDPTFGKTARTLP